MGACDVVGSALFVVAIGLASLLPYTIALCGCCLGMCLPRGCQKAYNTSLSRLLLRLTGFCWRAALLCCCWIRFEELDLQDADTDSAKERIGSSGRPVVVVSNHTSFMDVLFLTSQFPLSPLGKVKMFVSGHVFKMPVFGRLTTGMGHLAVPFKSNSTGAFELDKELLAQRQELMEEFLHEGGIPAWFPEGTVNRVNPYELATFRAGGFKLAVENDVEIWCIVHCGNATCWPPSAPVGGRPARIGYTITRMCRSSHEFLDEHARHEESKTVYLANYTKGHVQTLLDKLRKEGFS